MATTTIIVPTMEHFTTNPLEYDVIYSSLFGWMLKERGGECAIMLTSEQALDCIKHIRNSDNENPFHKQ